MTEENKSKIRFRFSGGEEFEAEGTQAFIEQQRNFFLSLINQTQIKTSTQFNNKLAIDPNLKQDPKASIPATSTPLLTKVSHPQTNPEPEEASPLRLWEPILKEEGAFVVLRKKYKISVQESAYLILAGMRVLLKKNECSALELSRALKASKIDIPNRLDRLLAGEIQQGYLFSQGAKRSRTYKLTDSGFAKAFVLAEKLLNSQN